MNDRTAEQDALRMKALRDALIDILDAAVCQWSEADDTTVFVIHLSEADFNKFSDLAMEAD